MKIENQPVSLLILHAILILLPVILQSIFLNLRPQPGTQEHKPKTPRPLKPKTEDDCPFYREEKGSCIEKPETCGTLRPWSEVRNRRGRKKSIFTQGYACNNQECVYYRIMDERMHALVGYGSHGKHEKVRDLMCQTSGKKFTVRLDTVLYRLKTHSEKVVQALALMAEGVDISMLERVMGIGEGTLRTWLAYAGSHAVRLHGVFFMEIIFLHLRVDDAFDSAKRQANAPHKAHDVWLWVAIEATTKVIPVMKLGPRTLYMAMGVVHELCERMPSGSMPIFTSDGLKLYFYALTAHFGHWALDVGIRKPLWEFTADFLYAQVKKIHRRRRLVKVEHLMLSREREEMTAGLKALGLSGKINTAFVERLNLTIRQCVSFLVRRTWGTAQFTS